MSKLLTTAAMAFVFAGSLNAAYALDNNSSKPMDKGATVAKADGIKKHRAHGKKAAPAPKEEATKAN